MLTILNTSSANPSWSGKVVIEGVCLSGDAKPSVYGNGSKLMELDTSTLYIYDETNDTWRAWE